MDSQLVNHKGGLRLRAAIFMKGIQGNVVAAFTNKDLVSEQIKCREGKN